MSESLATGERRLPGAADVAAANAQQAQPPAQAQANAAPSHEFVGHDIVGGFDAEFYLAHNPDVAAAGVDPHVHYDTFGWKEGRDPSASFDTLGYLAANPDVAAAHVNPLDHYLQFGVHEGRAVINDGIWH
jgi:hypothetical protein